MTPSYIFEVIKEKKEEYIFLLASCELFVETEKEELKKAKKGK